MGSFSLLLTYWSACPLPVRLGFHEGGLGTTGRRGVGRRSSSPVLFIIAVGGNPIGILEK